MNIARRPTWLFAALALSLTARAAEFWEAPAFSTPATQLLQAATAVHHARATDVVVLLDERTFVLDEQHRLTRTTRMIYRVDSPDGVARWAASAAHWQPWHQARPEIHARVVTPDGRQHDIDPKLLNDSGTREGGSQVFDDDHVLEGPLPAVEVGAVIEEEITVRDEKPFFTGGSLFLAIIAGPAPGEHPPLPIGAPQVPPLEGPPPPPAGAQ